MCVRRQDSAVDSDEFIAELDRQGNMRLRDEFAMAALPALIRNYPCVSFDIVVRDAYAYADRMLEQREVIHGKWDTQE
jgi:hypothetical protein